MKKPHVAIVHYSCPPVIGGVEFIVEAHAREFIKAGFDVRMIVGRGDAVLPEVQTVVIPEMSSSGGPISSVLRSLSKGVFPSAFDAAVQQVEKQLLHALRGIDVCMMHNVLTMHFNLVLTVALSRIMKRRGKKIRFIGWTHDLTFSDPLYESHQHRRYPWNLLGRSLEGCQYCVISKERQKQMKRIFRQPLSYFPVIPDGIDVPRQLHLHPRVKKLFYKEQLAGVDIVVLTPARILRRKNLGVGMEIIGELKKLNKTVRWIITGAPDAHNSESVKYFKMLVSLRRRLKLKKEVIFLCERFEGRVKNNELRSIYRMADMLLFPSESEGFGLPVLEAGLAGLLVVVSDIPALRELSGDNAVYIDLNGPFSRVAKNIISAIKKRPQMQDRKRILFNYSWDVLFERKILPAVLKPGTVWRKK